MRYLILIAILLIPAWGWAETDGQKAIKNAGKDWVRCEQLYGPTGSECRVKDDMIEVRQSCEQRMREAMKAMGMLMDDRKVISTIASQAMKHQWNQTMKDCVEGR